MTETRYAGFWIRVAAYLIDSLVVSAITIFLALLTGLVAVSAGASDDVSLLIGIAVFYIGRYPLALLYFSVMESSGKQATIGKLALGLKVINVSGKRISFVRAVWRVFVKLISGPFTAGLIFLVIVLDKKKQGLHDMMAHTLVVRE